MDIHLKAYGWMLSQTMIFKYHGDHSEIRQDSLVSGWRTLRVCMLLGKALLP